ncbi:hypothetical protein ABID29_001635 [Streptococcus rupicaprae]|uniref:Phage protein n=1 Tax=Streptococcus rupicaprae TaxID=759619 RepID=A0ABV2FIW3_9STRE
MTTEKEIKKTTQYQIHFKDGVPDLTKPAFQEHLTPVKTVGDMVIVNSSISDVELRQLIMNETGLPAKSVIVVPLKKYAIGHVF